MQPPHLTRALDHYCNAKPALRGGLLAGRAVPRPHPCNEVDLSGHAIPFSETALSEVDLEAPGPACTLLQYRGLLSGPSEVSLNG